MIVETRSGEWSPGLSEGERETLFRIVRDTLAWCAGAGRFSMDDYRMTPALQARTATFVTLKRGGRLRGCIGSLEPVEAMYRSVHDNAVHAALRDPRFPAVTAAEVPDLDVQISLLSPLREIDSADAFAVGKDGVILEKGRHRAVFLPEVAVEQGWNRAQMLASLSLKAGLAADGWKSGARFKTFYTVSLSEQGGASRGEGACTGSISD